MTKKTRLGRPPKLAENKCSAVLYLKLTPTERAAIDAAAQRKAQPVSAWAKALLLKAAK